MNIPEAREVPLIHSDATDCVNKKIYLLDGERGLWRRVARSGSGIKVSVDGAKLGVIGDSLAEFQRAANVEASLTQAGFVLESENSLSLSLTTPEKPLANILRSK